MSRKQVIFYRMTLIVIAIVAAFSVFIKWMKSDVAWKTIEAHSPDVLEQETMRTFTLDRHNQLVFVCSANDIWVYWLNEEERPSFQHFPKHQLIKGENDHPVDWVGWEKSAYSLYLLTPNMQTIEKIKLYIDGIKQDVDSLWYKGRTFYYIFETEPIDKPILYEAIDERGEVVDSNRINV